MHREEVLVAGLLSRAKRVYPCDPTNSQENLLEGHRLSQPQQDGDLLFVPTLQPEQPELRPLAKRRDELDYLLHRTARRDTKLHPAGADINRIPADLST